MWRRSPRVLGSQVVLGNGISNRKGDEILIQIWERRKVPSQNMKQIRKKNLGMASFSWKVYGHLGFWRVLGV